MRFVVLINGFSGPKTLRDFQDTDPQSQELCLVCSADSVALGSVLSLPYY